MLRVGKRKRIRKKRGMKRRRKERMKNNSKMGTSRTSSNLAVLQMTTEPHKNIIASIN